MNAMKFQQLLLLLFALPYAGCASPQIPSAAIQDKRPVSKSVAQESVTAGTFDRLWNYQEVSGTRGRFEALLDEAESGWPLDLHLQLLTQIARTFSLQSQFDEAHGLLDEVESALPEGNSVASIRYSLERGRTFNSNQKPERARRMFLQAWEMSNELEQAGYAVDAAHMLGILESGQASLEWSHQAMQVAEACDDPSVKGWLGPLYNNTGWTHHENGDFDQAMELWTKAEAWHQEFGSPRTQSVARWTLARCERSLGNCEKALRLQLELLAETGANRDGTGYTREEIAENLWTLKRRDESREYFADAHDILAKDPWLQANEPERLARLQRLAAGAAE